MRLGELVTRIFLAVTVTLAAQSLALAASDQSHALLQALRNLDETRARQLIDQTKDLDARDETGATALMWAIQRGNSGLAMRLLEAGANPNIHNAEQVGPLQLALEQRSTEIALQLIAHGANAKAARENGETVLMTAARTGQLEVMKQLIARGARVNAREKQFHQTALMWSAGYPEQVKLLIAKGANVKARTKSWQVTNVIYSHLTHEGTPWHHSGEYKSNKGGQSALFFAVLQDDVESVKLLLDAGSDVNETAADGSTPLLLSLYKWNPGGKRYARGCDVEPNPLTFVPNAQIAQLLLDRGATATVSDATGYTPLHGAVLGLVPRARLNKCRIAAIEIDEAKTLRDVPFDAAQGVALVKRLLELKADPNAVTHYPTSGPVGYVRLNPARVGSSPVHIAAAAMSPELMRLLLEHGGDPNLIRSDGHSPLSLATQVDDLPLVELLVAHGADPKRTYNPTDPVINDFNGSQASQSEHPRRNQTILHIAAVAGAYRVVPFLVANGASVNAKNDDGETPLSLAENQEKVRHAFNIKEATQMRAANISNIRDPATIVREFHTSEAIRQLLHTDTQAAVHTGPTTSR